MAAFTAALQQLIHDPSQRQRRGKSCASGHVSNTVGKWPGSTSSPFTMI
ncbi:MAG: hypothetical protein M5U34_00015 [Chloroflexi bacterium]|nr:hypothetical protein [Chloroflexota bacterium]